MATDLVHRQQTGLVPEHIGAEQLDLIKRTVANGATNDELTLFLYQARRTGLDPLARQIHFVKRGGKGVTQVGIDGYRLIADRTGQYAGNDDPEYGPGEPPEWARVTVWKLVQGVRCPFTATARWTEYFPGEQQGFMWKKLPRLMIGKVAESLALRKAFPAELSGVYTDVEMDQAGTADAARQVEDVPVEIAADTRRLAPPQDEPHPADEAPAEWRQAERTVQGEMPRGGNGYANPGSTPATPKQLQTIQRMARAAGRPVSTENLTRSQASALISELIGEMEQRV